jgi:AcrR family transcriptional regulator
MAFKQRARKDEDKRARRAAILQTAATMLGRHQYGSITMAEVARRCGLAKGTLYLYFRSKEELFLATLERELTGWFDAFAADAPRWAPADPETFGHRLAHSLAERERLADLLPLLHAVLEHNIEPQTALSFKQMLRDRLQIGGRLVEALLPGLRRGDGHRLLLRVHALVIGLRQMADPAPSVAAVLRREELAALRIDFETELATTITDMTRGMLTTLPGDTGRQ